MNTLAKIRTPLFSLLFSFSLYTPSSFAQITFGPNQEKTSSEAVVRDLNWMNHNYLEKQRKKADAAIRAAVGRQLHQGRGDIKTIQRAIDKGAFNEADKETLQALGAALGDVFTNEHKLLSWKVYEDEAGASHAVCFDDTAHCLFPMTMLSRRMEAGLTPNVDIIFRKNLDAIKTHIPRLPYSREQ